MNNLNNFKDFGISAEIENFTGDKIKIQKVIGKEIIVKAYKIGPSNIEGYGPRLDLQIEFANEPRVIFTGGKYLIQVIEKIPKDRFPFATKIVENEEHLEFS